MLKQKEILPNINYVTPNPRINFEKLLLDVQTEASIYILYVYSCVYL